MTVEVHVQAEPTGGLRLIDGIPATRPCRLEGRNGIGKTATIKLLSLVTGSQPFANDTAAWRSLKEHLQDGATITFSGLEGDSAAAITLTPSHWPELPESRVGDALGELTVNGTPQPVSKLSQLLEIHHLTGTERLVDTLSGRVSEYGSALAVVEARLAQLEPQRAQLGELAAELDEVSPEHDEQDRSAAAQRARERDLGRQQQTSLTRRLATVQRGLALQALLQDSDFQERAQTLAAAAEDARAARELAQDLDSQIEELIAKLEAGSKAARTLASAERRQNAALRKRNARLTRLSQLAQQLHLPGLDPDGESASPTASEVSDLADAAEAEYREHEWNYRQSLMTDAQRRLHSELTLVLEQAQQAGLAQYAVVRLEGQDITVAELVDALTAPVPPGSAREDKVDELAERSSRLSEAAELLVEQEEFDASFAEAAAQLERLRSTTPEQDELNAELAAAIGRRDDAEQRALRATQQIGRLQAQGVTADGAAAAQAELDEVLASEGLDGEELLARAHELTSALSATATSIDAAMKELEVIDQRQASRGLHRRNLEARLSSDSTLSWLTPAGSTPPAVPDEAWWAAAARRARVFADRLDALVTAVSGLHYAAGSPGKSAYRLAIEAAVEQEAVSDFADPAIREALFDGGTPVAVDLQRETITWNTVDDGRLEKPLSTFSSGEQALGFIRARLRQLAEAPAADRIVFLDEFGAFLSADRRHPLAELLKGDQLTRLADQVVIVLPLQVDYRAQLENVTGGLHDDYLRRADQIDAHGYFTEEFA